MRHFEGLIAATHTPMTGGGQLHLDMVERQAEHLLATDVRGVFPGGTTGEGASLTVDERLQLTQRWVDVARGTDLSVIVHAGHNSLPAACQIAAHAQRVGADAVGSIAPSFFKPSTVERLVDYCSAVAAAAPELPFYYYDIPPLTGVELPMDEFLKQGKPRIPSLAGIKYTNFDLSQMQTCLRLDDGAFDILFGRDETLMAGLVLGCRGAVGSTYNFAAPLYHRIIDAYRRGDLDQARTDQARSVTMAHAIAPYGLVAAAKTVMSMIGIDCGPARSPLAALTPEQVASLRGDLEQIGFFDWALQCPTAC